MYFLTSYWSLPLCFFFFGRGVQSDEKYRCSETGYRIPLKCMEIKDGEKIGNGEVSQSERSTSEVFPKNARLLTDSFVKDNKPEAYITYRSCIPAINEEKLSVLGFEV